MSLILQKIAEHLRNILIMPEPSQMLCPSTATPAEPSELWLIAKDILAMYSPGSSGRMEIIGVFLNRIIENPKLIQRLHPATNFFHRELITEIMKHPKLTEDLRSKMLINPEITAVLL
jgi:hypothetical protein